LIADDVIKVSKFTALYNTLTKMKLW